MSYTCALMSNTLAGKQRPASHSIWRSYNPAGYAQRRFSGLSRLARGREHADSRSSA